MDATASMAVNEDGGFTGDMEIEAYRRLFPLPYYERHFIESLRPDARPLSQARDTTVALGPVATADGSALVKIGDTVDDARSDKARSDDSNAESPDDGSLAIDFIMPPICSPAIRPGRPAEAAPITSKQLSDVIASSGMLNMKELSLVSGKAAWMVYMDIYCLNADGSLFDAALLSAVAAFSHLQIPLVSVNDDGKVVAVSDENQQSKYKKEIVNSEKRKLKFSAVPFSLTCILYKKYILADPTAEEESIMDTTITLVLTSADQLISIYKPGGSVPASTSTIQDCVKLVKHRVKELSDILEETVSMEEDLL